MTSKTQGWFLHWGPRPSAAAAPGGAWGAARGVALGGRQRQTVTQRRWWCRTTRKGQTSSPSPPPSPSPSPSPFPARPLSLSLSLQPPAPLSDRCSRAWGGQDNRMWAVLPNNNPRAGNPGWQSKRGCVGHTPSKTSRLQPSPLRLTCRARLCNRVYWIITRKCLIDCLIFA